MKLYNFDEAGRRINAAGKPYTRPTIPTAGPLTDADRAGIKTDVERGMPPLMLSATWGLGVPLAAELVAKHSQQSAHLDAEARKRRKHARHVHVGYLDGYARRR